MTDLKQTMEMTVLSRLFPNSKPQLVESDLDSFRQRKLPYLMNQAIEAVSSTRIAGVETSPRFRVAHLHKIYQPKNLPVVEHLIQEASTPRGQTARSDHSAPKSSRGVPIDHPPGEHHPCKHRKHTRTSACYSCVQAKVAFPALPTTPRQDTSSGRIGVSTWSSVRPSISSRSREQAEQDRQPGGAYKSRHLSKVLDEFPVELRNLSNMEYQRYLTKHYDETEVVRMLAEAIIQGDESGFLDVYDKLIPESVPQDHFDALKERARRLAGSDAFIRAHHAGADASGSKPGGGPTLPTTSAALQKSLSRAVLDVPVPVPRCGKASRHPGVAWGYPHPH